MFGGGPTTLAILLFVGGGLAPFGIPPLPPDPVVLQAGPEKCLIYFSSAGTGQPDKAGENHTDQLLSNAEVRAFLSACAKQFSSAVEQYGQTNQQIQPMIGIAQPIVETILSRPMAVYVDRIELGPPGPPKVVAGLIVNCGPRKADVTAAVDLLEKMASAQAAAAPGGVAIDDAKLGDVAMRHIKLGSGDDVHWGFKDDYFLATIGAEAATQLVARIGAKGVKPPWLTSLEKQTGIKRVSTIRYVNVAELMATIVPAIPSGKYDVSAILNEAGLKDISSIGSISGFSTRGMVSRTIANFSGTPKGLFNLLAGKPLTADDLKPIPGNALSALALRLDLNRLYTTATDLVEKADPKAGPQLKQGATAAAQAFGFRLKEDILDSFGDVWTVHSMPPTAADASPSLVATVAVKNKDALLKIQGLALGMVKAQGDKAAFSVSESKISDVQAWQAVPTQSGAPSPAWAIAGNRLVVAASLDALKAHLEPASGGPSLAEQAGVISRLKTQPILLTYLDTKATLEEWMGKAQAFAPMGAAMLAQFGVNVEVPPLPTFKAIAPHALPQTSTLRLAKQMIVSETYESVPLVGNAISLAPAIGEALQRLGPMLQPAQPGAPAAVGAPPGIGVPPAIGQ